MLLYAVRTKALRASPDLKDVSGGITVDRIDNKTYVLLAATSQNRPPGGGVAIVARTKARHGNRCPAAPLGETSQRRALKS